MKILAVLLAATFVSHVSAFFKADLCDDWVGDKVFRAFEKTCDEVYDFFNEQSRAIEDLCLDNKSDGSPKSIPALAYASNCCSSNVSSCPVAQLFPVPNSTILPVPNPVSISQLCKDDIQYTPNKIAYGETSCGELAHQWAYTDRDQQCTVRSNEMAYFASSCCSDGISVCSISQLCMDDIQFTPNEIAYGESSCVESAQQWAYTDVDQQCETNEVLMSSYSNLCCLDGLSV